MRLLSYLLLDGHASPMYKALIDTNLGSEFSSNTGYDNSTRYVCFSAMHYVWLLMLCIVQAQCLLGYKV
jgi:Zn-dependent M16 (insulinase) family peptidase